MDSTNVQNGQHQCPIFRPQLSFSVFVVLPLAKQLQPIEADTSRLQ